MDSIIQVNKECFFCGTTYGLESHHVFGGADRPVSERFGLKVWLCHSHHNEPPEGVHFNRRNREQLMLIAKARFYEQNPELNFIDYFRKEYV